MKYIRRLVSCLVTASLIISTLLLMTRLTERKDSEAKYSDFLGQKENFDVLFFGSSRVINGVFPMELWNDYGIVSYNFGGHANTTCVDYWMMKNSLDYTTPKLVVIDCPGILSNYKTAKDSLSFLHQSFDAFPLSVTKIQAVNDLLTDPEISTGLGEEAQSKLSLLWDFSVYHSRWNEINKTDLIRHRSPEKGAESRIAVTPGVFEKCDVEKRSEETIGLQYLRKIIEECQENDIDVLLMFLPFPAESWHQVSALTVTDISKEYGVPYINFLDLDVVNYSTDCYDAKSHLNPSGARKVTDYLGEFIREHYDIPDQRQNSRYKKWYEDYQTYCQRKRDNLKAQTTLENYLMLMKDKHLNAVIEVNHHEPFQCELYSELFKNIGVAPQDVTEKTRWIIIEKGGEKVVYDRSTDTVSSPLGEVKRVITPAADEESNDSVSLFLDDRQLYQTDGGSEYTLRITLLDERTSEVIDSVSYYFSKTKELNADAKEKTKLELSRIVR